VTIALASPPVCAFQRFEACARACRPTCPTPPAIGCLLADGFSAHWSASVAARLIPGVDFVLSPARARVEIHFHAARRAIAAGRFDGASTILRRALVGLPDSFSRHRRHSPRLLKPQPAPHRSHGPEGQTCGRSPAFSYASCSHSSPPAALAGAHRCVIARVCVSGCARSPAPRPTTACSRASLPLHFVYCDRSRRSAHPNIARYFLARRSVFRRREFVGIAGGCGRIFSARKRDTGAGSSFRVPPCALRFSREIRRCSSRRRAPISSDARPVLKGQ